MYTTNNVYYKQQRRLDSGALFLLQTYQNTASLPKTNYYSVVGSVDINVLNIC